MRTIMLTIMTCLAALGTIVPASALEYADLANRLVDLEGLAVLPARGEQCAQWSSYDRRSRYDAAADTYIDWGANGDGYGVIRSEGDTVVLAEMEGPGCIWRIWSADPGDGHVKIYLDGSLEPAIDLPFKAYFDLKHEPFVYPALVYTAALGRNSYVPIPYRKSCKVVAENGWGRYYHFTYSSFPKGTVVPTFQGALTAEEKTSLSRVDELL
jgi:hypothetical protein